MTCNVLVIDDELAEHALYEAWLEDDPAYALSSSESIEEGIASIEASQPDVVILDFLMLDGDGFEALEQIIQRPNPPSVIFMTGYGNPAMQVDALAMGAKKYFAKSEVTAEALKQAISDLCTHQV